MRKTAIRVQRLPKRLPWMARANSAALRGSGWTEAGAKKSSATWPKNGKGWVDAQPSLFGLMGRNVRT